jgi:hypothetical protein
VKNALLLALLLPACSSAADPMVVCQKLVEAGLAESC